MYMALLWYIMGGLYLVEILFKNEGVSIVVNPVVAAAWRDSGEC